jgi:hypothetical protein
VRVCTSTHCPVCVRGDVVEVVRPTQALVEGEDAHASAPPTRECVHRECVRRAGRRRPTPPPSPWRLPSKWGCVHSQSETPYTAPNPSNHLLHSPTVLRRPAWVLRFSEPGSSPLAPIAQKNPRVMASLKPAGPGRQPGEKQTRADARLGTAPFRVARSGACACPPPPFTHQTDAVHHRLLTGQVCEGRREAREQPGARRGRQRRRARGACGGVVGAAPVVGLQLSGSSAAGAQRCSVAPTDRPNPCCWPLCR